MQSVMQQFDRPETRIGTNKRCRSRARLVAGLVALVLLAAACTSDGPADFSIDDGAQSPATGSDNDQGADDDGNGGTGDGAGDDDNGAVGGDDDPTGTDNDSDGNGDGTTEPPLIEGVCGIDQVNRQPFYAVANIEDDDPDGGLNIRDDFEAGEKLATVAEGDVVYVEDCYRRDDGSAWYAVETADGVNGWANSAYLSDVISPFEPTFGGVETAGMVEDLLDVLASREWEEAAEMFLIPDVPSVPIAALLDDPPDPDGEDPDGEEDEDAEVEEPTPLERLALQLEAYCDVRICDAPYRIEAVRGSYVPRRFGPEVDVSFTYSGGIVTETFGRLTWATESGDDVFVLDTLPGQSILAFKLSQPSADELVANPDQAPAGLLEAAESVRRSLLSESGPRIDSDLVPADGIAISTSAYVEPSAAARPVITGQDLRGPDGEPRIWGYRDGVGTPIVDTVEGQLAGYRRAPALLAPDEVGVDERIGRGNTIANLPEVFSAAHTVEFHRQGRGDLADFAWSSVRMAFERQGGDWKLVAITSDTWTI